MLGKLRQKLCSLQLDLHSRHAIPLKLCAGRCRAHAASKEGAFVGHATGLPRPCKQSIAGYKVEMKLLQIIAWSNMVEHSILSASGTACCASSCAAQGSDLSMGKPSEDFDAGLW